MNWEKNKGPCKSGELSSSQCDHAPFTQGRIRPRQTPVEPNEKPSTTNQSGTRRISFRPRDCCSLRLPTSTTSRRYTCSVPLPAELFMRREHVPLQHFNVLLTWPAATSRTDLISTGTMTKSKGNQREQPVSISHPLHSSFPPSLNLSLQPFCFYYRRAQ